MTEKQSYLLLPGDEEIADTVDGRNGYMVTKSTSLWRKRLHELIFGCWMVSMMIASFFLGQYYNVAKQETTSSWTASLRQAPSHYIQQEFQYSPEFGAAPPSNNATEPLWDALVPKGQGFVRDPADAKNPSALSVVHQLHCLYAIRRKAFLQEGDVISGLNPEHMHPAHLRHCFDYLRQTLLCHADTTLEPWNEKLGGVTGWGAPRMCRDYEQVKVWAEERRINDRTGFIEVGQKHQHQHANHHDKSDQNGMKDGDVTFTTTTSSDRGSKSDGDITFTTTTSDDDNSNDGDITFTTAPDNDTSNDGDITFTTVPDNDDAGNITFTNIPDDDITFTTTTSDGDDVDNDEDGNITFTTVPDDDDNNDNDDKDITFTTTTMDE